MDRRNDFPRTQCELQLQTRELLEAASNLEVSMIDLIVAASECSEDASEIGDLVDELVASGRLQIRRRDADPMFARSH